jgi:hypothetical protein
MEVVRNRATMIDGRAAADALAEQLNFAYVQSGIPGLSQLGHKVSYSKSTLSKVLAGRMLPRWELVRDLGIQLRIPKTSCSVSGWRFGLRLRFIGND